MTHQMSLIGADKRIINLLVNSGYNIHLQDENGNTALDYAVAGGNGEAVQFMTDHGVRLNAPLSPLDEEEASWLALGDIIFHQYLGKGTIRKIEDWEQEKVIAVDFGGTGETKNISVAIAPIRILWEM